MKKRRHRQWYIPVFEEGIKELQMTKKLPVHAIAFDNFTDAYSYAASLRLSPVRDENGELVLDEKGLAQLPNFGKINILEIDGKKLDWKRIESISNTFRLKGMAPTHDAIQINYEYPFHKNSIRTLKEESDEFFERSMIKKEA